MFFDIGSGSEELIPGDPGRFYFRAVIGAGF